MSINLYEELPEELLLTIYQYLNKPIDIANCERVCKNWQSVLNKHPEIWRRLLLMIAPLHPPSNHPKKDIVKRITLAREMKISNSPLNLIPIVGIIYSLFYTRLNLALPAPTQPQNASQRLHNIARGILALIPGSDFLYHYLYRNN